MKTYYMGLDTETGNSFIIDDKLDLTQSLVYDIGWQVIDKKGKVYIKRSFVISEIFLNADIMSSAYYAEKIPAYWEDIKAGKRILTSFYKARQQFFRDRKKYRIKIVFAHNARFDYRALNNTIRYLTKSKYRYFFPYKIEIWDTLKMSRDVFKYNSEYTIFCDTHGFKTCHKIPQNRYTAEALYCFISNNPDFKESHTGLEDVEIETKILLYCLNSGIKTRKRLFE